MASGSSKKKSKGNTKKPLSKTAEIAAKFSHDDLVSAGVVWLRRPPWRCTLVFAEMQTKGTRIVPDVLAFKRSRSFLIEAKRTRSDFLGDKKKRSYIKNRIPGRLRWYLTPAGLIVPDKELPEGWGLLEIDTAGKIRSVVKAPARQLTPEQRDIETIMLVSAVRRHEVGRTWDHDRAKFGRYTK